MGFSAEAVIGPLLDEDECALVDRALTAVARLRPADASVMMGLLDQLRSTSALLEAQRPLRMPTSFGGEPRDEETLKRHLCALDGLSGDLALPFKATLSRTYLLSKINFLRGFVKATAALAPTEPEFGPMAHDLREELAQSIYTLLGEELFLALLRKPDIDRAVKRLVADQLISVWDDAKLEIDDFAPLLESAWHARNRINANYGTLLGATETFRLVCEDCSPEVVDFFARDDMSELEAQAFEEFLFNMTHEELATLRRAMRRNEVRVIGPAWAANVLGRDIEELEHSHEIDPMALYRSFQRRQLAADYRLVSSAPGPRRTAEGYLLVGLLTRACA